MALAAGCGPGLASQVRLNEMGTRAADHCVAQKRKPKCEKDPASAECAQATVACRDSLKCVEAVRDSVAETQRVQLARAVGTASDADETVVRIKQDSALLECKPFDTSRRK